MLSILGELIVNRYVAESITNDAGRFSHIDFCQLCTKLYAVDKSLRELVIDSATYLLTHVCTYIMNGVHPEDVR